MKLYADTPLHRIRQIVGDLLVVWWIVAWVSIALTVHDGTLALGAPGRTLESSATRLSDGLSEAGDFLDRVPVIGEGAAAPFDKAADASDSLAESGRAEVRAVERLAFWLGLSVGAIPILIVLAFYGPLRWRFVREATAGRRFVDTHEDLDLFALRALTRQPMHVLARVSDDPAGDWRARKPEIVSALGLLELRDSGLKPRRSSALDARAG